MLFVVKSPVAQTDELPDAPAVTCRTSEPHVSVADCPAPRFTVEPSPIDKLSPELVRFAVLPAAKDPVKAAPLIVKVDAAQLMLAVPESVAALEPQVTFSDEEPVSLSELPFDKLKVLPEADPSILTVTPVASLMVAFFIPLRVAVPLLAPEDRVKSTTEFDSVSPATALLNAFVRVAPADDAPKDVFPNQFWRF